MSDSLRLAERCVAGERAAQRELYEAHRRRAHRALYRILGTNGPMDDLLQDVFVNVFRSLPSYRGDAPLSAWVDRVAVRVAYAHIGQRRRLPVPIGAELEVATESPSADRTLAAREAMARLYALLARLDPKLQVAFALHVIDDRPLAEVAALMDATVMATKTRVWRARREVVARARRDPALADLVNHLDAEPARSENEGTA